MMYIQIVLLSAHALLCIVDIVGLGRHNVKHVGLPKECTPPPENETLQALLKPAAAAVGPGGGEAGGVEGGWAVLHPQNVILDK